jgi:hypothetical protein
MKHLLYAITEPVVCAKCADEFAAGGTQATSLQSYIRVDVGFTERGVQVWCQRHSVNVVHIDFADARPNADFRCLERKVN